MKKVLLLAVLAVVLVAMPAFASVQNVKVSGDIESTYLYRNQFDLGGATGTDNQSFFFTQTQLRVDADLTDKVSATVRLLNERPWGVEDSTADNSDVDLNLAYVTVKEMLYSPLTVVVGRQAFAYGNSLVVNSTGPNRTVTGGGLDSLAEDFSKRSAMDAIRAILDYNPLTIDLVYAKIDAQGLGSAVADQKDDVDLFGVNANWKLGDKNDTVLEGYFWAKVDRSALAGTTAGETKKTDTIYVPGVRAQVNVLDGLMLSGEVALQRGTDTGTAASGEPAANRNALAWQAIANYALPFEKTKEYSPVLTTAVTYLSGDKEGAYSAGPATLGVKNTAWDPFFEAQSAGKIYNTLFDYSNSYILSLKGSLKPIEDVTASAEYTGLWLDKQQNVAAIFNPEGGTNSTTAEFGSKKLGDEIDLGLSYAYTEDVTIGASLGWFFPGDVFQSVNDKAATQAIVNLDVKF